MSALQHPPSYVRALIHSVPEQERFGFGNGGQLLSEERVRLPFLIAGKIVLVWISAVPGASLGLLLGTDVLDTLGAVHDFLGNRIQFQLLSPDHWVRLEHLRAGHSSIPCLPAPLLFGLRCQIILGLPFVSHMLGSSHGSATSSWASPTKTSNDSLPSATNSFSKPSMKA